MHAAFQNTVILYPETEKKSMKVKKSQSARGNAMLHRQYHGRYAATNVMSALKIKDKFEGKKFNNIQKRNNGCTKCRFNNNEKMKEDKYLIAISKLYNMSIDDILSYY